MRYSLYALDARVRHASTMVAASMLLALCTACERGGDETGATRVARPGGPYRLVLETRPALPRAGEPTQLELALSYAADGRPVTDLLRAHERVVHNFVVAHDFSSFAHVHHEDFAPLAERDLAAARLRFPYTFPAPGRYRVVSEFAHRDRAWIKHVDIDVSAGNAAIAPRSNVDDGLSAVLVTSPRQPVAGFETGLALDIFRHGAPATDLALYLGSELHGAVWREDMRYFGHLHSYTPRVAAIMASAHDRGGDPVTRGARIAEMMVKLMCLEAEQSFTGPRIPLRYVFPAPGRYRLFLQAAPGGKPRVFSFEVEVVAPEPGVETGIDEAVVAVDGWRA